MRFELAPAEIAVRVVDSGGRKSHVGTTVGESHQPRAYCVKVSKLRHIHMLPLLWAQQHDSFGVRDKRFSCRNSALHIGQRYIIHQNKRNAPCCRGF